MNNSIIIVEDDPVISLALELLLGMDYTIIGNYNCAEEALTKIKATTPDLVLLDVHLDDNKTGTWLGNQINLLNKEISLIYLTAYNDKKTIDDIMQTLPECYLLKPFDENALLTNVKLLFLKRTIKTKSKSEKEHIFIKDNLVIHKIVCDDIIYIMSDENYLKIVCTNNKNYHTRLKIGDITNLLPKHKFIRTHRRYLVNYKYIISYDRSEIHINGIKIPISKSYRSSFFEFIQNQFS